MSCRLDSNRNRHRSFDSLSLILHIDGIAAIEAGVRIRYADHIRLGNNVYLDEGVYLHACPSGIEIGDNSFVMHGSVLHVYNFRDLPDACIRIGKESLIGEMNVLRGRGITSEIVFILLRLYRC